MTRPNAGDTTVTLSVVFTENNPNTNQFYVQTNDLGYGGATSGDTNTASPSNQATTLAGALDGDDCVTDVKTTHTDDKGNVYSSENTAPSNSCATPYAPSTPTVRGLEPTVLQVRINANSSETGSVQYAVRVVRGSSTYYLQSNTTLGASEDWTLSAGTLMNIQGLLSDVSYSVSVKSRNPSDTSVESDFSTESTLRTPSGRRNQSSDLPTSNKNVAEFIDRDKDQQKEDKQQVKTLDELLTVYTEDPNTIFRTDRFLGLTATFDNGAVVLNWTKNPEYEKPMYTEIYRNYNPVREQISLLRGVRYGTLQYIDSKNIQHGKTYYYRIKVLDEKQNHVLSDVVGVKIPVDPDVKTKKVEVLRERLLDILISPNALFLFQDLLPEN